MAGIEDLLNQEAGYTYGDILPIRSRTDGSGNPEFAVPGLISGTINSAINAFTLPGDVAAGRREVTPADNVNFALNVSGLGALGRVAPRASLAVEERVLGQRLKNAVVPEPNPAAPQDKFSRMINGRPLTSPEQVTHGRRNISRAELEDALKRGRFVVPEGGTKFNPSGSKTKWWSAADDQGIFGRPWDRKDSYAVRLPVNKIPTNRAASTRHAEVFDPATTSWMPLREYGKKYSIGGTVIDDGNPAKQRKLI